MKNKILTGVAIILLIVCSFNIVFAASQSELNAKKNELLNKTNSTKEKLNEVKDEKKDATTELETINKSITELANENIDFEDFEKVLNKDSEVFLLSDSITEIYIQRLTEYNSHFNYAYGKSNSSGYFQKPF